MKHLLYFLLVFIGASCTIGKHKQNQSSAYQVAFYNVENLFDTLDAPKTKDEEFTPGGKKQWNTIRYREKLDRIAQVISSIDSNGTLVAIGLAEVENRKVLEDLVVHPQLKHLKLDIIHEESPDFRGIDVALLFNAEKFKVKGYSANEVALEGEYRTTRDILKVNVEDQKGKSLAIYVNHWPSRWGGQEKTEPKRIQAAETLKQLIANANDDRILIMGDLNDYPDNKSVLEVLGADSLPGKALYNATWPIHKATEMGTHYYKGHWGVLDQIIVSDQLRSDVAEVYVLNKRYLMYENKQKKWSPSRSYGGSRYYGGYSDHLPVVIKFK